MKSIVFSIVMTIRKGLSNLTVTGTDMGTISMLVAAAASVPVSSTFTTALWMACEETDILQVKGGGVQN